MKKENHVPLTDKTIYLILEYIRDQGLKEGDLLPSGNNLVEEFKISRVIFREAMSYLKGLGVIEGGKGNYYRIARIDPAAILEKVLPVAFYTTPNYDELFQLRCTLELGLIEDAVENASEEHIKDIENVITRMQELISSDDFKPAKYDELELEFHRKIAVASGSRLLCVLNEILRQSFAKSKWSGAPADYRQIAESSTIGHQMIAYAFRMKDSASAYSSLRNQFKN